MVITISNQYGSGALEIAERVAAILGYAYVDRQLPVVVAKRLRVRPDAVEANEDASPTLGERFLTGLERATPELAASSTVEDFDEEVLRAVQEAVREYAERGDAVIVGRGAAAILGTRPGVLRVFLHAPRDWRIAHVCESTGATRAIAESELDRVDRARTEYLRQWYGLAFGDPRNYDVCIDVSRFTPTQCVNLIVAATQ